MTVSPVFQADRPRSLPEGLLDDVLRLIRLKSCVYFARDFHAPWAMQMDQGQFAQFHAVLGGNCVVRTAAEEHHGAPGDIFLFPRSAAHVIADRATSPSVPGPDFMASLAAGRPLFADGGAPTRLLCGHYEYARDAVHPLIDELPDLVKISTAREPVGGVLSALVTEVGTGAPENSAVVEKLAEALLVRIIRSHAAESPRPAGFLAALGDPRLSRAIRLIHEAPGRKLTLQELAAEAGMSRSAFALRFRQVLGISPVAYLTQWRMCRAFDLLRNQGISVAQAAADVGYDSDVSFGRSFKSVFGVSPGAIRRNPQGGWEYAET